MRRGRNRVVSLGMPILLGFAAAGVARADPATDAYNQGPRLLETGQASEAIPYRDRVALLPARDIPGHGSSGAPWSRRGDFGEAIVDLDRQIEFDPLNPWAYGMRGLLWLLEGNHVEASRDFARCFDLDPSLRKVLTPLIKLAEAKCAGRL